MSQQVTSPTQIAASTNTGRVRGANQDSFGYRVEDGLFLVADGMGGAAGGDVASRLAVDAALEALHDAGAAGNLQEALEKAFAVSNKAVYSSAERDPKLHGMGTTLVLLALAAERAWIAHVGDSRCYLFRDGKLERSTKDHSLVDEQVRLGQLTQEEADRSPFRNVITRAIGTQPSVTAEIDDVVTASGDIFLLCTDGLTRELSDERIAEILRGSSDLEASCHSLVDAANAAGGHDNITCLLVRIP
jgi:serine/threonine protein phosphatase PrpC